MNAKTEEKWGSGVVAGGFTIVPNHLVAINQYLPSARRISPTEMFVLLQILSAWWAADKLPFPSKATIAARTDLSERQVQRAISSLEKKGLLERIARFTGGQGRKSNIYDLSRLVQLLKEYSDKSPNIFKSAE